MYAQLATIKHQYTPFFILFCSYFIFGCVDCEHTIIDSLDNSLEVGTRFLRISGGPRVDESQNVEYASETHRELSTSNQMTMTLCVGTFLPVLVQPLQLGYNWAQCT